MPRPARRSRKLRRIVRKIPSGKVKIHYKRRISKKLKCAVCKKNLQGSTKNGKRPTRKFGGNICHRCCQQILKLTERVKSKELDIRDVNIRYKKYLEEIL